MIFEKKFSLRKIASELKQHQKRVADKLRSNDGIIADHSLGSGKTITGINAAYEAYKRNPNKHVLIIGPASVTSNFEKEMKELKINFGNKLLLMSYERASNISEDLAKKDYSIIVLDEAHKLRNPSTKRTQNLKKLFGKADKRLFLTGTPIYNKPEDLAPLVNMVANKKVLPEKPSDFSSAYIKTDREEIGFLKRIMGVKPQTTRSLKNKKDLEEKIAPYFDYYDAIEKSKEDFPEKVEKIVEVEMDKEQERVYDYLMGEIPFFLKWKIKNGLPLDKREKSSLNSFSTGVRQASNSINPFSKEEEIITSPKIEKAIESIKDSIFKNKSFRGVTYSNYLEAGLKPMEKRLKEEGIEAHLFTGSLNKKQKEEIINNFNNIKDEKPKVLLLSSSGAEGINLKGVNKLQVMEPHFNKSKTKQVIGRGIRYKSHDHLPKELRNVEVEHFLSVKKPGFSNKFLGMNREVSIDKYLYEMSENKDTFIDEVKEIIKKKGSK